MLEVLLGLTIAALLLIVTIRQYHAKQLSTDQALVRSDVALLSSALRSYVKKTGCYNKDSENAGYFAGPAEPSLQEVARISGVALPERRDPIITQYRVGVDDVVNQTEVGPHIRHRFWIEGVLGDSFQEARDAMAGLLSGSVCGRDICWYMSLFGDDNALGMSRVVAFMRTLSEEDSSVVDQPTSLAACWLRKAA